MLADNVIDHGFTFFAGFRVYTDFNQFMSKQGCFNLIVYVFGEAFTANNNGWTQGMCFGSQSF